jgi:SAM-dependent methyltransferase
MGWKSRLKGILPRSLHHLYNRIISRRHIQRKYGDWFDAEWKRRAPDADKQTWREVYDRSWEHWDEPDLTSLDVARIRAAVTPETTLLDAGCGDGWLLERIGDICSKQRVGVDISRIALNLAQQRLGKSALLVQADLEKLPFRDSAFGSTVSAHTLEHIRDFGAAVAELRRVARQIIILVPVQEYLPYTEDYHLHFFSDVQTLVNRVGIAGAVCERYEVPKGEGKYEGEVLLLVADANERSDRSGGRTFSPPLRAG